jgi:hypothetical protein
MVLFGLGFLGLWWVLTMVGGTPICRGSAKISFKWATIAVTSAGSDAGNVRLLDICDNIWDELNWELGGNKAVIR